MVDGHKLEKQAQALAEIHPLIAHPGLPVFSGNPEDYPDGIVLPIDKPYRWTSADVIRKVKYAAKKHFGKKNLKVGHAGTLDPLATGVLLVCIGKATRLAEVFQAHDKEYIAGITFGATTPSYDREKEIDRFFPHAHITREVIEEALPAFLGEQDQVAPLFSAKSVDGVRAYELARKLFKEQQATGAKGDFDEAAQEVIRTSRITISELELLSFTPATCKEGEAEARFRANATGPAINAETTGGASSRIHVTDNSALGLPEAKIRIACSKGTYIRAFARDLGEAVGSGAHLASLARSRSGGFRQEEALTVDEACALLGLLPKDWTDKR